MIPLANPVYGFSEYIDVLRAVFRRTIPDQAVPGAVN
jgi:hypothetical protein